MRRLTTFFLSVSTALIAVPASANDLDWLAGHWCGQSGKTFSEETWMAPRGGLLVGMHRDTRDGRATGFEFMRIAAQDGRWVFLAQPGGKAATAFPAERVEKDRAVFANPAHDFPKRVIYSRPDVDTLHARIDDGRDDGQAMEWTWRRDCVAPPSS
ncbi:DUF6265 family protein [Pseudoxanthomonas japonensis]|uniref:DUF6265 domain-containing protein n=1 Tax=Pseudoxanthomonas japonensis TaxID=69284 RepID=A0ABQ6ZJW3_9GAMM|nr:DUF6265 family protein [Pseudoxanthomonas japonensis]KAF1726439.1 hypothetical protein CSC78_04910 [Pseudoxanthomonas japonensis]